MADCVRNQINTKYNEQEICTAPVLPLNVVFPDACCHSTPLVLLSVPSEVIRVFQTRRRSSVIRRASLCVVPPVGRHSTSPLGPGQGVWWGPSTPSVREETLPPTQCARASRYRCSSFSFPAAVAASPAQAGGSLVAGIVVQENMSLFVMSLWELIPIFPFWWRGPSLFTTYINGSTHMFHVHVGIHPYFLLTYK